MKLKMAKNSLFAILLRSPWWVSLAIAAVLALLAMALLPADYRVIGALSGAPFIVIAALAARRQWRLPSATQVQQADTSLRVITWPAFAQLLEAAFRRDGYTVQRGAGDAYDFELERQGQRMLVSARRWKSARIGVEGLRALQTARQQTDVSHAVYIGLGELSDSARPYVVEHRITIWQSAELAQALRGLLPVATSNRR